MILLDHLITEFLITEIHGDVLVLTPVWRGQWASRAMRSKRGGVEPAVSSCDEQFEQAGERSRLHLQTKQSWGCTGFDAVIGKSGLRVRALFSVINEHLKRNDNKVVSMADFRAARALAA